MVAMVRKRERENNCSVISQTRIDKLLRIIQLEVFICALLSLADMPSTFLLVATVAMLPFW